MNTTTVSSTPKFSLGQLWHDLTTPIVVQKNIEPRRARLLITIALSLVFVGVIIGVIVPSLAQRTLVFSGVTVGSVVVLGVVYGLSRYGYYIVSAYSIIGVLVVAPLVSIIQPTPNNPPTTAVLGLCAAAVLLTAVLLPRQRSILFVAIAVGLIYLIIIPRYIPTATAATPMSVLVSVTLFTFLFDNFRRVLEQDRQADLVALNATLAAEVEERKKAQERAEQLAAIVESTSDLVSSASMDGQIRYINSAGFKMIGAIEREGKPRLIPEFSPAWSSAIIGEQGIPAALRDGTWTGETALLSPDGREIPVSQTIIAHKNPDGSPAYLSTIARDITEQKRLQAEAAANARRTRDLLDNMPIFALLTTPDGRMIEVNAPIYYMMELQTGALLNTPFADAPWFAHSQSMQDLARAQLNIAMQGQARTFEVDAVVAQGRKIDVMVSIGPIFDDDGRVANLVITGVDITLLKQAEQEQKRLIKDLQAAKRLAEENSRLKSEFLSTMSHELRTPLNAIEGFTGVVLKKMGGAEYNEKTENYLKRVHSNSGRLLQLINDFLDLSRVEAGRLELAHLPFNPAQLAQRWHDELESLSERKGLTFTLTIDPSLPETIQGDEEAISKVVINLLSNAIKFTETGGVTLALTCADGQWHIEITDTGIGIPPHAREFIFEEFRQVDQSSRRKYGGTGLGLAIVQRYTRSMGGSVSVKSEIGQGSSFVVSLPLGTTLASGE